MVYIVKHSIRLIFCMSFESNSLIDSPGYQRSHKHDLNQTIQSRYLYAHCGKQHYQIKRICPTYN